MYQCCHCDFPNLATANSVCPKCGESSSSSTGQASLLEIDIAHQGETWEEARSKLLQAIDSSLHAGRKGVKIIHGYGSTTGQAVIAPRAIALMRQMAEQYQGRYVKDKHTQGASLIWWNTRSTSQNSLQKQDSSSELQTNWFEQALNNHKR